MTPALTRALDALARGDQATLASVPDGFDALVVADLARGARRIGGRAGGAGPRRPRRAAAAGAPERAAIRRARDRGPGLPGLGLPALRPRVAEHRRHGAAHDGALAARPLALVGGAPAHPVDHGERGRAARAAARPHGDGELLGRARQRGRQPTRSSRWLEINGFLRTGTVRDTGEYAVRGGIIDLYPPGCRTRSGSTSSATRSNRSAPSIRRRSARSGSCAPSTSCR